MNEPRRLPVIERPIDNTALSTFMRCPRKYDLSMRKGWRQKDKAQALNFGSFWHRLLETHYKTGGNPSSVLDTYIKWQGEVPDNGDYRTAPRALACYEQYRKTYNIKNDVRETVGWPEAPMVEISTAISSPVLLHEYAGKLDRIVSVGGLGYVEDHKTTSRLDKYFFKQFENSNQMLGYVWMARQLVTDIKVVGVRINLAHILTNKTSFDRQIITFSDSRIAEWEDNTNRWLRRLERSIEEEDFPAHYGDNGCNGKYGRCEFFDVCSTPLRIRDSVLQQDFHLDPWDPLAYEEEPS
jgi:hypothetical protein